MILMSDIWRNQLRNYTRYLFEVSFNVQRTGSQRRLMGQDVNTIELLMMRKRCTHGLELIAPTALVTWLWLVIMPALLAPVE